MQIDNFLVGTAFEENYKGILRRILRNGFRRDVRGFKTIELSPFIYRTLNVDKNILSNKTRKINKAFAVAEFLWMMSGRDDLKMLSFYNKKISDYSDDGVTLSGAYGKNLKPQLEVVLKKLKEDIYTRQAVINIWQDVKRESKDVPCTISMQFIVNSFNELEFIVNMRSNDAWLGLPYDFFNFTTIQQYVAMKLGLSVGYYTHVVGSMHIYDENRKLAEEVSAQPTMISDITGLSTFLYDQLDEFKKAEENLRVKKIKDSILTGKWKEMYDILETFNERKLNEK